MLAGEWLLDGDAAGIIWPFTSAGGGLCVRNLAVSGLRCDLVRRYTPSVVSFLTMYDLGSFAALRTVPGCQVWVR